MTLWKKTLLAIAISIGILFVSLYWMQRYLLFGAVAALEEQYMRRDVERATDAVRIELERLDALAQRWAAWDDTYRFAQDHNDQFRRDNLPDRAFSDLAIDFLLIVDPAGQIAYSRARDPADGTVLALPEFQQDSLPPSSPLLLHPGVESHVSGIKLVSRGPLLVASRPILSSDGQGPIGGALVMGRFVEGALVAQWSALVKRALSVERSDDAALPPEFAPALEAVANATHPVVRIGERRLVGYGIMRAVDGDAAMILRVESPRDIFLVGQLTFRYLAAAVALVGVLFWGVIVLLIDRTVLSRFGELGRQVTRLGAAADLSQRLSFGGDDEAGRLAGQVNGMLSDLQQARESIRWRERYLEGLARAAQSLLAVEPEVPYAAFLAALGQAMAASRVGVFLNQPGMSGDLQTSLKAEWCAEGTKALLNDAQAHNLSLASNGLERWVQVLQRGEAVQGTVDDLPHREAAFARSLGTLALVALPLVVDGAWVGMIAFQQCDAARKWEPAEVDLMRAAAADLGQALQRVRRDKVQSATYRLTQAALSVQDLPAFFASVDALVRELMPVRNFWIAVRDPGTHKLSFPHMAGDAQGQSEPEPLAKELTEYVAKSGEPLLVPLNILERMGDKGAAPSSSAPAADWLGVPLKVQERVIGVLAAHSSIQGGRFGAEELDLLNFVSAQVAMVVQRMQARQRRGKAGTAASGAEDAESAPAGGAPPDA